MRRVVAFALALVATSVSLPLAEERTLVTVDLTDPGMPISDFVYGVSDISFVQNDSTLAFPLIRFGGNHTTRYNWRANAWNAARDWFYLNIPQDYTKGQKGEELSYTDRLILRQVPAGRHVLLTAPMLGWVAKGRAPSWGYSVRRYGPQQKVETSESGGDAGNGLLPSGEPLL